MTSRELPPAEWHRLNGTEAESVWPALNPENTRVLVVEDEGVIVGVWLMLRVVHAECLWVAQSHRGSVGVAKRLFRGMREIAAAWGVGRVVTGSVDPYVTDLIMRFGGTPMPCESFTLPVEMVRGTAKINRALGRRFHRQITALAPDGAHPDDAEHDEMVGRTMRTAIAQHQPEQAMASYNQWAAKAGYEPIKYLGTVDGRMRVDIVTAKIEVSDDYAVRLMEA